VELIAALPDWFGTPESNAAYACSGSFEIHFLAVRPEQHRRGIGRRLIDHGVDVWMAMAEHFLDTETRHELPHTAFCCLRAGYTLEEARAIWTLEVWPALGFNLRYVAGEWAGWDRDWLIERIGKPRTPGLLSRLLSRVGGASSGDWVASERCMLALLETPPEQRGQRLALLEQTALHCLAPATVGDEADLGAARLRRAIE
jgi:GNAT superfamily N-acetyltransferase